MKIKSPKLIVNKLILVGREKSYTVPFYEGLNIIHGDSDTGKSSILNLIDYLLGSKKVYRYDEIEQHGKYALLEVELNEKTYTIKRDIFDSKEMIEVYSSNIEEMDSVFPHEYSPNYNVEGPSGFYSDFLLSSLNIPIITVKESPSKENSKMVRLSFRDIFKYCYFDQDDVGSREILDRKNYTLIAKNKETFKFLHNALDSQITELQREISEKKRKKSDLLSKYNTISSFLSETKFSTEESLHSKKEEIVEDISILESEISNLTNKMRADNQEMEELRADVFNHEEMVNDLIKRKSLKETQLGQNIRLKKDYQSDINKLQTTLKVKNSKSLQHFHKVECPLCNNIIDNDDVKKHFVEHNEDILKKEINSIRNRIKDLTNLIEQLRDEIFLIENNLEETTEKLNNVKSKLDLAAEEYISPYISQRDMYVSELYTLKEHLDRIDYFLKVRKQLGEIKEEESTLKDQIDELNKKLDSLIEQSPSIEDTLFNIGTFLKEFLEFIPISKAFGISINEKTFLPTVRNRDYTDLTSGGLRTLVSLGYIVSLLKNSLTMDTNYPSLVIIDTVGKYLGKTSKNEQEEIRATKEEGLDDPKKYLNIYKYLEKMSEAFLDEGKKHQIILVDNDFPEDLQTDFNKYVVKRFSTEKKKGYEIGFINNAK
ncbi:hypothetical protein ACJROX_07715 [Pseudalkalibacillus sp. A8]|uniref:hypothetical protein n=1 Tax=Pseudalkalibacillus sp. A8 TaxID=3382641 RepID=UPI0038B4BE97